MTEFHIRQWQETLGIVKDGDFGPATLAKSMAVIAASPQRAPERPASASIAASAYPREADMVAFYGPRAGPDCTAGLVTLPMPFVIAWDRSEKVTSFRCHKKLAAPITEIFRQAFNHYGEGAMRDLGLNIFGGCYNPRKKRGSETVWSIHSWGAAVDLDPDNNTMRMDHTEASFARPEYLPFWAIVEANGGVSLGRERNFDWQHFQFARL